MNQDTELDIFKREIDLRQFAVSLGYELDRRESWRGSTVLRSGGDKIVVKRNGNGHYVFFSVRDDRDHGTVIDFLQRREDLSLGAVRQILRPWIGQPAIPLQFSSWSRPARTGCVWKASTVAWSTGYDILIWSMSVVCRRVCSRRYGLSAGCRPTATGMQCFPISTSQDCAATKSRIADLPVSRPISSRSTGGVSANSTSLPSRPTASATSTS